MVKSSALASRRPVLQGILPWDRSMLSTDLLAGVSLAAIAIPTVLGYARIAGMPVVTGLYTILIPLALYAFFGSSRHMVVAADSATAAILAATLTGLATAGSTEYVALAGVVALITALYLLIARIGGLAFLADFLSRTVLIGFLTGVGIHIVVNEIPGLLGIPGGGNTPLQKLTTAIQQIPQISWPTVAVSASVFAIVLGCRAINRKIPGALIAVVLFIVLSYALNLQAYGVAVLGPVSGGLPQIGLPRASLDLETLQTLLVASFSIFVVILAQSAATSRAYATRHKEHVDENVDLVGLTLANVGAGLSGTFMVNSSPTQTQMVDSSGGRSQVAQLTTVLIVVLVLLFLTGPLAYMPSAVLASVVCITGAGLIKIADMRAILDQRREEFWIALIAVLVVVLVGIEQGILVAMLLSLFVHVRHGYRPRNSVVTVENGSFRQVPVDEPVPAAPGLLIYRFSHSMYYANAEQLSSELRSLLDLEPPARCICLDMEAVDDVDFSAAATLRELAADVEAGGRRLLLANLRSDVRDSLRRSGLETIIGEDSIAPDLDAVLSICSANFMRNPEQGAAPE